MRVLFALVAMIWPLSLSAQPSPDPLGPSILETGSEVVDVQSFSLRAADGQGPDDRIGLLIPRREAPEAGFPVLFMLDGQAVMELLSDDFLASLDTARMPLIVTLGYDTRQRFAGDARARDYTPPAADGGPVEDPRGRPGGGAAAFLDRLQTAILPEIEARVPVDMGRSRIWGHSYAGLFVLWSAGNPASPFARHVAASPSLWWDYGSFLTRISAQLEAGDWPARALDLHKGALERERASNPDNPNAQKLVKMRAALPEGALEALDAELRQAGVPGRLEIFPDLSHGETFRASARRVVEEGFSATEAR